MQRDVEVYMVEMIDDRDSLSLDEAMHYLGISRSQLYRIFERKELPSFHIGTRRFVLKREVDRFIQKQVEAEGRT